MGVNWNLYETFYIVAKCNSFSQAANKLYISQPLVSNAVKQLENELNTKLFYRYPNGIGITSDGAELFQYIEKSRNLILSGERNLQESKNFLHGKVSIGVQSHIGEFFLFPYVEEFHKDYSNIKVNIISRNTKEMIEALEANRIDFMIDTSPIESKYNNLTIIPLIDLENCFISKNKLVNNRIHLTDLANYNLILPVEKSTPRRELDKVCSNINIELKPFMSIETTEMLINAVRKDMGIGYVIKQAVETDINKGKFYEISVFEKLPTLKLNLVYIDEYLTNIPRMFMNRIKEEYIN